MNKAIKAVVVVALLAGCGPDRIRDLGDGAGGPAGGAANDPAVVDTAPPVEPDAPPAERLYELRLRGAKADGFASLLVVPDAIRISADGAPVRVEPTWRLVDLANPEHAERIAQFAIPEGARELEFHVALGAAGGFARGDTRGWLDTRATELHFKASVGEVIRRERSVVVVDVSRSLAERDGAYVLVPSFRVY